MRSALNAETRVGGIIAEYNPFHNGHAYQIKKARSLGLSYLVAVMSGDFVQRGTPAICSKWERTRMALENGIDLVLELPVGSAVSSAAYFAQGAVSLLDGLGVVTDLVFGCENNSPDALWEIARVFIEEPAPFLETLKEQLRAGDSYPRARSKALLSLGLPLGGEIKELLSLPNNLLALEYVKALLLLNSSIRPCPILRKGAGHHGEELEEKDREEDREEEEGEEEGEEGEDIGRIRSAGELRRALEGEAEPWQALEAAMPKKAAGRLMSLHREGLTLFPRDLDPLLALRLFQADEGQLCRHGEISPDLARRILSKRSSYRGMEDFAALLKTKQLTHTRIRRGLLHLILGIEKSQERCSYARVLGFRRESSALLRSIQEKGSLPLITKPANGQLLREDTQTLFASNLYEALLQGKNPSHALCYDLSTSPVIL